MVVDKVVKLVFEVEADVMFCDVDSKLVVVDNEVDEMVLLEVVDEVDNKVVVEDEAEVILCEVVVKIVVVVVELDDNTDVVDDVDIKVVLIEVDVVSRVNLEYSVKWLIKS